MTYGAVVDQRGLPQMVAAAVTLTTRGLAFEMPGLWQAAAAAPGAGSLSIYAISLLT